MKLKGIEQYLCRNLDDYKQPAANKMVTVKGDETHTFSLVANRGAAYFGGTSRSVGRGWPKGHFLPGLILLNEFCQDTMSALGI